MPLSTLAAPVVDLFCDARGFPPRVAAVIVEAGQGIEYTDWQPPRAVLKCFQSREDDQIMGLELLAVLVGMITFKERLRGKVVRIWEDNKGAEGALRKSSSKSDDHNLIVHGVWLFAACNNFSIWVERVPSHENIADEPSRECYQLLEAMGATWVRPVLHNNLWEPSKWIAWKSA